MLKTLLGIRIRAFLDSMFNRKRGRAGRRGGAGTKVLMGFLFAYCAVVFGGMFGMFFIAMSEPFTQAGMQWLYFAMAGILATALCFIGSVFFTQSTVFDAKDNDLLMAMPVKPSAILGSRLAMLLLLNYGYSLLITIPCGVVCCMTMTITVKGVVLYVLGMLLLPLIASALTCVIGLIIALISARMRNKNIFTLILSLAFFGAYMVVCFNLQNYIMKLVENGAAIAQAVQSALPPFHAMGLAMSQGDIGQFLIYALWCIVPFAAVYALLSRFFLRIATMKRGAKKARYQAKALRASSVRRALMVKELRHFVSSAMYMLNGGLGTLMAVLLGALLLIKRDTVMQFISTEFAPGVDLSMWIAPVACALLSMVMSMNIISAPSVSLEGKNLWLAQSLPIPAGDALVAKAYAHIVVCVPASLIASLLTVLALPMSIPMALCVILLPALISCFCAFFGVLVNLRWPRFDYVNEAVTIKQGMSTMIAMFASMGIVALPVILYAAVFKASFPVEYLMYICIAALIGITYLIYRYLTGSKAARTFAHLNQD